MRGDPPRGRSVRRRLHRPCRPISPGSRRIGNGLLTTLHLGLARKRGRCSVSWWREKAGPGRPVARREPAFHLGELEAPGCRLPSTWNRPGARLHPQADHPEADATHPGRGAIRQPIGPARDAGRRMVARPVEDSCRRDGIRWWRHPGDRAIGPEDDAFEPVGGLLQVSSTGR